MKDYSSSEHERGERAGTDEWRRGSTAFHKSTALKAKEALRAIVAKPGISGKELAEMGLAGGLTLLQRHGLVYFKCKREVIDGRVKQPQFWYPA